MAVQSAARRRTATVHRTTAAASFGFALVQLDVTIVNVALPQIGADFGASVAGLQWVVDAYALVFAALLLTAGDLGDRYGARRVYLGGLALFAGASFLCGLAPDATSLVAGRALQGIGAAAMVPASLTLLNHTSSHDAGLRAKAIGWWTAAGAITIAAGPIIGGLLVGAVGWRWIFLVNLPVTLVGAWLTSRCPETARTESGRGVDLPGQALAIVALALLIAVVIEAKPLGFADPRVILGFAAALIAGTAFVAVEARATSPMLPLTLFRAPGFAACILYGIVVNLTYYGIIFVLSLYLQRGLHYSATAAGLAYLPLTATFFVVNVASGMLVARVGSRLPMVFGALVDAVGFVLLLGLGLETPYVAMLVPFALMPAGMGTGVPAMTAATLACVPKEMSGIAAAVLNAARQAAGAIGVAVFGALAGDGRIVAGLHQSAIIAVILLLAAAGLAAVGLPKRSTRAEDA